MYKKTIRKKYETPNLRVYTPMLQSVLCTSDAAQIEEYSKNVYEWDDETTI